MLELPKINWFVQNGCALKNIYSASVGTSGKEGFINKTIFVYKVFATEKQNGVVLSTECFYRRPWDSTKKESEIVSKEFEASSEGINHAKDWISEVFVKNPI